MIYFIYFTNQGNFASDSEHWRNYSCLEFAQLGNCDSHSFVEGSIQDNMQEEAITPQEVGQDTDQQLDWQGEEEELSLVDWEEYY